MNLPAFTTELCHILIFKTDVQSHEDRQGIISRFEEMAHVDEVSVDIEDVDRVLRIVSKKLGAAEIIRIVNMQGFKCEELN